MIVYELITNAARHAFAGRDGEIRVELLRAGAFVRCKVLDNGAAPAHVQRGRGLKIVGELIKALDGRFEQKFGTAGSMSILVFPYSEGSARPQEQPVPTEAGSMPTYESLGTDDRDGPEDRWKPSI
jgi:two-component sensor histidine kinase